MIQSKMSEIIDHEAISFFNIVRFYRDQLLQIQNGKPSKTVFSKKKSSNLARDGVLHVDYSRKPHQHVLTKRAIQTLDTINRLEVKNI
jgi:hypothetical protein